MSENLETVSTNESWKSKTLIFGSVIGALVGAGAAYLLIKNAESEDEKVEIGPGEGVRLGLIALGLLRQIAELSPKKKDK